MNDLEIALLVRARNNITDRIESDEHDTNTADIDAILSTVPPGYDNDVDLLLGRMCAILPQRPAYFVNPAVTLRDAAPLAEAQAAKFAAHVAIVQQQLDEQCAAMLAQHNADVDRRKANGGKRYGGMTYLDKLEAAQREGKV